MKIKNDIASCLKVRFRYLDGSRESWHRECIVPRCWFDKDPDGVICQLTDAGMLRWPLNVGNDRPGCRFEFPAYYRRFGSHVRIRQSGGYDV